MPRFTWTDTTIAEALEPVVAELGRMPTRAELKQRGLANLWEAMRRRGGVERWASTHAGNGAPPAQAVRERAYFISLDSPVPDPLADWLQAERELSRR
jgi:hypothetical protein